MGFIEDELQEIRKLCEHVIPGSRLISCVKSMVRVEIKRTGAKTVVVCLQFPDSYPSSLILLELKSKTLSEKLLLKLTDACEQHLKKQLGKPQVLHALRFIRNFIDESPLCPCYDEIVEIKKKILDRDELKLKQKTSTIQLKITEGKYYVNSKFIVPDDYPTKGVRIEACTNFPPSLERYLLGQAREISRKCVEAPLRLPKNTTFVPSPSFLKTANLFVDAIRQLPKQHCQLCKRPGLPENPEEAETDETSGDHIERLFCNHFFHLDCLITFMKTPPFQGKKCPECGERIFHEKWRVPERLAEARWAHEEARKRELEDVAQAFM